VRYRPILRTQYALARAVAKQAGLFWRLVAGGKRLFKFLNRLGFTISNNFLQMQIYRHPLRRQRRIQKCHKTKTCWGFRVVWCGSTRLEDAVILIDDLLAALDAI
jgi:hypothetical protein